MKGFLAVDVSPMSKGRFACPFIPFFFLYVSRSLFCGVFFNLEEKNKV